MRSHMGSCHDRDADVVAVAYGRYRREQHRCGSQSSLRFRTVVRLLVRGPSLRFDSATCRLVLRYLDDEFVPGSEAPWITLYALKAFMIAWQLVRGGVAEAMQTVGIEDGDVARALSWAKRAFHLRAKRKLGKVVVACFDRVEA
jgi:hypothetical protein